MARGAREVSFSGIYHVISRGNNKMNIFNADEDRKRYLSLLKESSKEDFEIHGLALMSNHVHLLAETQLLSSKIQQLNVSYALWFNKKYGRIGHLFQDRFKSQPVEDERYYKHCLRYILRNPIKAGISNSINHPWNSYSAYYNRNESFICRDLVELYFKSEDDFNEFMNFPKSDIDVDYSFIEWDKSEKISELIELWEQVKGEINSINTSTDQVNKLMKYLEPFKHLSKRDISRVTGLSEYFLRKTL